MGHGTTRSSHPRSPPPPAAAGFRRSIPFQVPSSHKPQVEDRPWLLIPQGFEHTRKSLGKSRESVGALQTDARSSPEIPIWPDDGALAVWIENCPVDLTPPRRADFEAAVKAMLTLAGLRRHPAD